MQAQNGTVLSSFLFPLYQLTIRNNRKRLLILAATQTASAGNAELEAIMNILNQMKGIIPFTL
jgi:hypothetical protein